VLRLACCIQWLGRFRLLGGEDGLGGTDIVDVGKKYTSSTITASCWGSFGYAKDTA
jgi:hypothetical protein